MNKAHEAVRLCREAARPHAEKLAAAVGAASPDGVTLAQLGELALHARKAGALHLRFDDADGERLFYVPIDRLRAAAGACPSWQYCRAAWRCRVTVTITHRWLLLRWGEIGRLRLATWSVNDEEAAAALPIRSVQKLD